MTAPAATADLIEGIDVFMQHFGFLSLIVLLNTRYKMDEGREIGWGVEGGEPATGPGEPNIKVSKSTSNQSQPRRSLALRFAGRWQATTTPETSKVDAVECCL